MLPLASPPQSICIIRLSALGDVTHAVPVVRAIQKQWPETQITWICARLEHRLLSAIEGVRFIEINKSEGFGGYMALRRKLSAECFDVMLQMQTSARANFTGACVRARIKIGWDKFRARDLHRMFMTHSVPETRFEHQVQGHLSFARCIGLDADEPVWDFPVANDAKEFVDEHVPGDRKLLVISPCSSYPQRNWYADRYAAVADHAIGKLNMSVVLSGGPSELERETGDEICRLMQQEPINLIGKDTLPQLVAMLERADLVMSPDSGPVHLANALGTPVLGLYASTWSRRSGPYNSLELCVDKFPEAARKFRNKPPEELRWGTRINDPGVMELIEVDEVIERLEQALVQT